MSQKNNTTHDIRSTAMSLLRQFAGSENVVAIPRFFLLWTEDPTAAIILNQVLFHQQGDDWVEAPYSYWKTNYALGEKRVRNAIKRLQDMDIGFEKNVIKASDAPRLHLRVDPDRFIDALIARIKGQNDPVVWTETGGGVRNDPDERAGSTMTKGQEPLYIERDIERDMADADPTAIERPKRRGTKKPLQPPAAKDRNGQRRAIFAVVQREGFGIRHGDRVGGQTAGHIGKIVSELMSAIPDIDPDDLANAFRWHTGERNLAAPRAPAKVVAMVNDYRQYVARHEQQATTERPTRRPKEDIHLEMPEIIVDEQGRYVGDGRNSNE